LILEVVIVAPSTSHPQLMSCLQQHGGATFGWDSHNDIISPWLPLFFQFFSCQCLNVPLYWPQLPENLQPPGDGPQRFAGPQAPHGQKT
jgi:hypothetical protein